MGGFERRKITGLAIGALLMAPGASFAQERPVERLESGGGWNGQISVQTSSGCFDIEGNASYFRYSSGRIESEVEIARIGNSGTWRTIDQARTQQGGARLVEEVRDILEAGFYDSDRIVDSCPEVPLS